MPYWQLFYHLVWSTKGREPLLTPDVEPLVYDFLRRKAIGLGATLFALNGAADHVHLVAAVPPKLALAAFIGQVKGIASAKVNQQRSTNESFRWQEEYGAFSFDAKRLPNFVASVEAQKQHHALHTEIAALERTDDRSEPMLRENREVFSLDDEVWRAELKAR